MRMTHTLITALVLTLTATPVLGATGAYDYDARGHLTSVDYGNGSTITYTYE